MYAMLRCQLICVIGKRSTEQLQLSTWQLLTHQNATPLYANLGPTPSGGLMSSIIVESMSFGGDAWAALSSSRLSFSHQGRADGGPLPSFGASSPSPAANAASSNSFAADDDGSWRAARKASRCDCGRRRRSSLESILSVVSSRSNLQAHQDRRLPGQRPARPRPHSPLRTPEQLSCPPHQLRPPRIAATCPSSCASPQTRLLGRQRSGP